MNVFKVITEFSRDTLGSKFMLAAFSKIRTYAIRGMIAALIAVVTSGATVLYINHDLHKRKVKRLAQKRRGTRGHAKVIRRSDSNRLTNLHLEAESLIWTGLRKSHDIVGIRRQLKCVVDMKGLEMYVDGTTDLEKALGPDELSEAQKHAAVEAAMNHIFHDEVVEDIEEAALERDDSLMRLVSLGNGQVLSRWTRIYRNARMRVARYLGLGSMSIQA